MLNIVMTGVTLMINFMKEVVEVVKVWLLDFLMTGYVDEYTEQEDKD